jgi:hypothetical protein
VRSQDSTIELITNQLSPATNTISVLYKASRDIEIFFKDLKQLLKIKSFLGTRANAVLIQIWTALIRMLILKYVKACASYPWCLSDRVVFLRLNLFVKCNLNKLLDTPFQPFDKQYGPDPLQINLFDRGIET